MPTSVVAKSSTIATNLSGSRSSSAAYCESSNRFVSGSTESVAPFVSLKPLFALSASRSAAFASGGTSQTAALSSTSSRTASRQSMMTISPAAGRCWM